MLLSLVLGTSAGILLWLFTYSRYGIDFTDESFYLIWLENPYLYEASLSQFGYIYHPLYRLLDGNVAALRQFNIIITFGLAAVTANAVLGSVSGCRHLGFARRTAISAGLACASLALFSTWLTTPNYNSLNLQALLIAASGLAFSCSERASTQLRGQLLVGVGGWLSFMAKPSTTIALGVLVLLFWSLARRLSLRGLLISASTATALLLASALWIDGSIVTFANRLASGLQAAGHLGGGHSVSNVVRMDSFELTSPARMLIITLTALACASAVLLNGKWFVWRFLGIVLLGSMGALALFWTAGVFERQLDLGKFQRMLYASIPLAVLLIIIARWPNNSDRRWPFQSSRVLLLLALPVLSYAFAFGTNGNYWFTGSFAAYFWLMPALVLTTSGNAQHDPLLSLAPLIFAGQMITVLMLQSGMEQPYRQAQALSLNERVVEFGERGSTLVLSDSYADYVVSARDSARAAGMVPGTPMIDLSGQSPGILYALKAPSMGLAWMLGGYPGSARLATLALASAPCEKLAHAWVLSEPGGPRSLPDEVLGAFGAELAMHYEQVGSWTTAPGAGGFAKPRLQLLWKPVRQAMLAQNACEQATRKDAT